MQCYNLSDCGKMYAKCSDNARDKLDKYICQDKMRYCLSDYAKRYGTNNYWPWQTFENRSDTPYVGVIDMDNKFQPAFQTNPFSTPITQITNGSLGQANRTRHYQNLHGEIYGGVLKSGRPATRDPIYY